MTWAAGTTVGLSAASVVFLSTIGGADSITEIFPPRLLLASFAVVAVAVTVFAMRRQGWARNALVAMSAVTALFGLLYTLLSVGTILIVVVPWFVGGALVVALLFTGDAVEWFEPKRPLSLPGASGTT